MLYNADLPSHQRVQVTDTSAVCTFHICAILLLLNRLYKIAPVVFVYLTWFCFQRIFHFRTYVTPHYAGAYKIKKKKSIWLPVDVSNTVDSRYLEFQGALWNTSRRPYLDISDLQNWGKTNSHNHI